jgi:hypothetical protein
MCRKNSPVFAQRNLRLAKYLLNLSETVNRSRQTKYFFVERGLLIVITGLMLSVSFCPKAISLSSFHSKPAMLVNNILSVKKL